MDVTNESIPVHLAVYNFLPLSSPTLWLHAILAVVFLVIAIVFMRHFSVNLQYEEDEQVSVGVGGGGALVLTLNEFT